ncbi:hypothetical protein D3C76_636130 [compost metagenome]
MQRQARRIFESRYVQAGVIDYKIRILGGLFVKRRYPCRFMTLLFELQRQVIEGPARSNEQNVETSHVGLLVRSGSRSMRFARTASRAANCCEKIA